MAEDASRNLIPDQLKPLTGVAQRSGAKSGAKRFDLSSNQNASAGNQAGPHNLHSKSSFPSQQATKFSEYPIFERYDMAIIQFAT
jgi:hypothetical protein